MEISNEIRNRIIEAANQLYQDNDNQRFPTVDQVRRAAKADMNTTSMVMKEWRLQQTAAPAAVAVAILRTNRTTSLFSVLHSTRNDLD